MAAARHHRTTGSRWSQSTNLAPLIVVVLGAIGLAYTAAFPKHWLRGVLILALAMAVGAAFRATLPARQAGLLAVRSRFVDVLCYLGAAGAMATLGLWLRASGAT
jgi:DUF3017 family protein